VSAVLDTIVLLGHRRRNNIFVLSEAFALKIQVGHQLHARLERIATQLAFLVLVFAMLENIARHLL
jgi:predicted permease